MRLALRILALVSLALFGLSLVLDVSLYLSNPCPLRFLFQFYLVFVGAFGIVPTLIGSVLAARLAIVRGRWGWLAGLLAASGAGVVFLYGAALDQPLPVVEIPITTLSSTVDLALGLTTCGSGPSYSVQAAALTLVLLVAPLTLLSYSVSRASATASAASPAPRRMVSR
jgi:hypothetical protein